MDSEVDVAIVGYGPVGQALAALLGRAGHRVAAFERFNEIYRLPRAVHLDHEIMRLLQALGLADAVAGRDDPAARVPLVRRRRRAADDARRRSGPRASGWEPDYLFFQPELEARARRRARARMTGVTVERGWVAEGLVDDADGATLTVRRHREDEPGRLTPTDETRTVTGPLGRRRRRRQLVRARGGRHRPPRPRLPGALARRRRRAARHGCARRTCRPRASGATRARPTTHVQSGPRHRRWEFMLLPGEQSGGLRRPRARLGAARAVVSAAGRPADAHARSTSSARCSPSGCARAACCWPATPPT